MIVVVFLLETEVEAVGLVVVVVGFTLLVAVVVGACSWPTALDEGGPTAPKDRLILSIRLLRSSSSSFAADAGAGASVAVAVMWMYGFIEY